MRYFISAIGTDSGKTLISAMLTEALNADYWKPVQAGHPGDSEAIKNLVTNSHSKIFPERYFLEIPASPHSSAAQEGIEISVGDFQLPQSKNLIVEGAGGLLVPLNEKETMLDLIKELNIPVILVSDLYLGSINHTLLSCEVLYQNGIEVKGIIFNGESNTDSERVIESMTGYKVLFRVPKLPEVNSEVIKKLAVEFIDQNKDL